MGDQPYQFGDIVDGYRWTITGWEPVEAPERTVGVPRLLEKRYAATQEKQAREQAQTQTLEDPAPVVIPDAPDAPVAPVVAPETIAEPVGTVEPVAVEHTVEPAVEDAVDDSPQPSALSLEEILGGGRTVVAAPDLSVTFDAADSPAPAETEQPVASGETELPELPEPYDARPTSARSWYGLGLEPIEEPTDEVDAEAAQTPAVDPDDAFAAALELGARTFAEHYQPSEIEIAAGIASGAHRPADPWTAPATPAAPWTVEEPTVAPEPLDAHDAAYGSAAPEPADADGGTEPAAAPRPVTFTAPPPAGWYPGSV
jgi:hypothetical protein